MVIGDQGRDGFFARPLGQIECYRVKQHLGQEEDDQSDTDQYENKEGQSPKYVFPQFRGEPPSCSMMDFGLS